jgi:hypothetical protein
MLDRNAREIDANVHWANGDPERHEIIDRAASSLVNYVYEALQQRAVDYGTVVDAPVYRAIEQVVAAAMLAQHEVDEESLNQLLQSTIEYLGPPKSA